MKEPKFKLGQEVWAVVVANDYKYKPYHSKITCMSIRDSFTYYNVGCHPGLGEPLLFLTKKEAQKRADFENLSYDLRAIQRDLEHKKDYIQELEQRLKEIPEDIKKAQEEVKKLEKDCTSAQKKMEKMSKCHTS